MLIARQTVVVTGFALSDCSTYCPRKHLIPVIPSISGKPTNENEKRAQRSERKAKFCGLSQLFCNLSDSFDH
jgi:hypothetical protein